MSYKTQLVKLVNTAICIGASILAIRTFITSNLTDQLFKWLTVTINRYNILTLNETIIKTGFTLLILTYIIYNLYIGQTPNIMNIYHIDVLLILLEVFAHSRFQWLNIFLNINIYQPTKNFTETLFTALLILGGYIQLYFDSKFREKNREYTTRGINSLEIQETYTNQSLTSLTMTVFTFFTVIITSFLIENLTRLTKPIPIINNLNYIIFGILASITITSTLYIYLKEQ